MEFGHETISVEVPVYRVKNLVIDLHAIDSGNRIIPKPKFPGVAIPPKGDVRDLLVLELFFVLR